MFSFLKTHRGARSKRNVFVLIVDGEKWAADETFSFAEMCRAKWVLSENFSVSKKSPLNGSVKRVLNGFTGA